ncbi:hypothetical protein RRG08_007248 [Elysia crispata]|uniref:Uncharacterized protein n=1 Tax=Elysia crispata TaxID=231223 RepID=A0AAE0ZSS7_9GAST|nr:hypothetical protein RRG08_007248 [Elysia crispata]
MSTPSRRKCVTSPDSFCYICGSFMAPKQKRNISDFVKRAYFSYFKLKLGDQDKTWAPHKVCHSCEESLRQWTKGKDKISFSIPMVWREPRDHITDCYFCLTCVSGFSTKSRHLIQYPNLDSAIRPVLYADDDTRPVFTELASLESDDEGSNVHDVAQQSSERNSDSDFELLSTELQTFSQAELNDLVRDLGLSKKLSELLASRLKEKNLLKAETKVTFFRDREKNLLEFFDCKSDFVYCCDIAGLVIVMGAPRYDPTDWRLFIDSSKRSLKCVLLHIGNIFGALPIGHSELLKENAGCILLGWPESPHSLHAQVGSLRPPCGVTKANIQNA